MNQIPFGDIIFAYKTLRELPKPTAREKEMLKHLEPHLYRHVMSIVGAQLVPTSPDSK